MRKTLLSTTAMAMAGTVALPAHAANWDLKWGGYMEQFVAYASNDADFSGSYDGIDSKQDAELHFLPSITLDNGIKIGANVEFEGFQSGDQIDESYMFIKGSFGEILLGSTNSAGFKMTYAAPDVTFLNVNSGSMTFYVPFSGTQGPTGAGGSGAGGAIATGNDIFRGTLGTTFLEVSGNDDAQRFTYFTPRFAGFQAGVSYARDGRQDDSSQVDTDGELHDIFDIGANYVNSLGGFDVALSGRYGFGDDNVGSNSKVWAVGLNLDYAGFTIGGSYGEQNGAGAMNGEAWDAGISYETGPWGFSFTYMHGENKDNENFGGVGGDEELDQYLLGLSYKLATGVKLGAYGAYVDFDEDNGDPGGANAANGDDVDGWVIGTGIKISF